MKTHIAYVLVSDHEDIYYEQALLSAYSLMYHNKDASIYLVVDKKTALTLTGSRSEISQYVKEMVDHYPIRKKPIMYVVPQGIDEDYFAMDCSNDSRVFLSVGAIGERKGHLLTLKAFEQLRGAGFKARLVMAGTVASQSYLELLEDAIRKSEYREDVTLCTNLSGQEIKDLYKGAQIFVLHTEEESQGIVFAEAMATGLPVVSINVGGVPYVVEHGKTGLLSNYGDINAFSENMRCLLDDAEKWKTMSEATKMASQNYHWLRICERIMQLYQSV